VKGQRLGKYFVDERIAVGGMAEIYRAHSSIGEPVAIKLIHPRYAQDPKFVQMFLDEAKIAIQLRHPNIVEMLEFGRVEETYFFSMEWIDGKALSAIAKRQQELNLPFPVDVALVILIDLLKGLEYAHSRRDRFDRPLGIVHRDVSPPNILITRAGVAKLADFGIADAESKVIKTKPGVIRGKFSYMSPEQSRGEPVDARSDVFSAGIVLWEILSGRRLFLREAEIETLEAVRKAEIPRLDRYRDDVPPGLERVLEKALAAEARKRYGSAMEFARALWRELKAIHSGAGHRTTAEFMKVLFPWKTFVGVEEPLKELLARMKRRKGAVASKAEEDLWGPADFFQRNRWPITLAAAFAAVLAAEWLART
jgi:serine/threonine protein kinase